MGTPPMRSPCRPRPGNCGRLLGMATRGRGLNIGPLTSRKRFRLSFSCAAQKAEVRSAARDPQTRVHHAHDLWSPAGSDNGVSSLMRRLETEYYRVHQSLPCG